MRFLKGSKRYIVLLIVVGISLCTWCLTRNAKYDSNLKLHKKKPYIFQTNNDLIVNPPARNGPLERIEDDSVKWSSNSALDRSGNKMKLENDGVIKESTWNKVNRKRIYEWNETVVLQGLLPLVRKLNVADTDNPRIIFNRVGKCGSRSVLDIFRLLAEKNKFNMIESLVYTQKLLPPEKEEMMANVLSQLQAPYLFQRHMYHINFSYYRLQTPSYINIIRDPISRFTSQYYYKRFGDGFQERTWKFNGTENERYRTINQCVLRHEYECSPKKTFYIVPFFCGNDPRCKYPTEWTLKRAMENVRRDFKVIGLLEELRDMFLVLEKIWPTVFNGCVRLLENPTEGQQFNRTAALTKAKEQPTLKVRAVLKKQMSLEYRFYNFVKSRFNALAKKLKIR